MTKQQKVKQSNRPLKEDPRALRILQKPTESPADALAHMILRPIVQAAVTLTAYNKDFGDVAINTLVDDLDAQCKLANNGDLARAETILMAQAQTLDSVFNNLARRASLNIGEYMNAAETYLRLALRAQAQCRATLETLAVIKNPQPVAFVRQANIANGPQQVNNAPAQPGESSRARESANQQNKLEAKSGERLEFGKADSARETNSSLEAVGPLHGAKDCSR
jgi:hypothetical protein